MKILILLILSFTQLAFSNHIFTGDLFDFDNQIISTCKIESKNRFFTDKKITLKRVEFLDQKSEQFKMKYFVNNGVNGKLYLPAKRKFTEYHYILNTDSSFNLIELDIVAGIGTLEESYKCRNFHEE